MKKTVKTVENKETKRTVKTNNNKNLTLEYLKEILDNEEFPFDVRYKEEYKYIVIKEDNKQIALIRNYLKDFKIISKSDVDYTSNKKIKKTVRQTKTEYEYIFNSRAQFKELLKLLQLV